MLQLILGGSRGSEYFYGPASSYYGPTSSSSCVCGLPNSKKRIVGDYIVGGQETKRHEYPWQVVCELVLSDYILPYN